MTELKCPFCQQELRCDNTWNEVYMCRNPKCKHLLGYGTKELWQALIDTKNHLTVERTTHDILQEELKKLQDELADTKKKLDIAVDAIDAGRTLARIAGFEMLATGMDVALEKIKDNDKDVK